MRTSLAATGDPGLAPWTGDLAWLHQRRFDHAAAVRFCRSSACRRDPSVLVGGWRLAKRQYHVLCALEAASGIVLDLFEMECSTDRRRRALDHWAGMLRTSSRVGRHPVTIVLSEADQGERIAGLLGDMAESASLLCGGCDSTCWESLLACCRRLVLPYAEALKVAFDIAKESQTAWLVDLLSGRFLCDRWCRLSREIGEGRCWLPSSWRGWLGIESLGPDLLDNPSASTLVCLAVEGTRGLFRGCLGALLEQTGPLRLNLLVRWFTGRARLHLVDELGAEVFRRQPPAGWAWLGRSALEAGLERLQGWLRWN